MSRRTERIHKQRREQYASDISWLMQQPQFRRYVANLIDTSGVETSSAMTGNSHTYYNLGVHDFVRGKLTELKSVALTEYRQMENEAIAAREQIDRQNDRGDTDAE